MSVQQSRDGLACHRPNPVQGSWQPL